MAFVVNDIVIAEDNCNLSCDYCLTGQSQFKADHSLQKIFNPPRAISCAAGSDLGSRLRQLLRASSDAGIPVVKLSGGEIFMVDGMLELIEEASPMYETLVILTNGTLLTKEALSRLEVLGNIVVQWSIDATRYEGNSYRVASEAAHARLMARLQDLLATALPLEIYLVLNDRSASYLRATCDDLLKHAGRLTVFPFPVRGPSRQAFVPKPHQIAEILKVIDSAEQWSPILPSSSYLGRLRQFYVAGERMHRCHLPRVAFSSFDDGTATACPNIWFNHAGNLLAEDPSEVLARLETSTFRRLLLADRPRVDACRACFTPWDPVSLYLDGQLSLDELTTIPVYAGSRTREELQRIGRAAGLPC